MIFRPFAYVILATLIDGGAVAEEIGAVDTAFKLIGANHKIVVEAFDDPKVKGVTCFLSMARKGGISGVWVWRKRRRTQPSPADRSVPSSSSRRSHRTTKANRYSRRGVRCCSRSFRWCGF